MFVEYIRILDKGGGDLESQWQLIGKLGLIVGVALVLIYLGYKLLGKYGAMAVFIFEAIIFALANDLVPFVKI
ncbi:MAG: hypothetical protein PVF26_14195 [Desulfobacterales bacterium]|jgi:hypothetical protein